MTKVHPIPLQLMAICLIWLPMTLSAQKGVTMQLENLEGIIITAEVLEKSKDKVKMRMAGRIYTLPLDQLSETAIAKVKEADVPQMANYRLDADFSKTTETHKSHRDIPGHEPGETERIFGSYREDTISGKVTVENGDNEDESPAGKLHVVMLVRHGSAIKPVGKEVFALGAIEALGKATFETKKAIYWHSKRGQPSTHSRHPPGKYYGYIAAIVVGGRVMEIKSVPSNYERNPEDAQRMLGIVNQAVIR